MLPLNCEEELLVYPRSSVLCWFAARVSALRPCHTFLQQDLCFPGLLTPGCGALGFGKSWKAGTGEIVKGKTRRSVASGLRVSFPSVCAVALVHIWKEMKGIAYNSKMTAFNKYFALYLQKGRGCCIAEQEVCCYNTIF